MPQLCGDFAEVLHTFETRGDKKEIPLHFVVLFLLDRSGGINYKMALIIRTMVKNCFSEFRTYFHNQRPMV